MASKSPHHLEVLRKSMTVLVALLLCMAFSSPNLFCIASPFNIVTINPGGVTQGSTYANITIYGARIGHRAFLMLKQSTYSSVAFNCTVPPTYESRMRTPEATVRIHGETNFYVNGLEPGQYVICYKNTSILVTNHSYARDPYTTNETIKTNLTNEYYHPSGYNQQNGTYNVTTERRQYLVKHHINHVYYQRERHNGFVELQPVVTVAYSKVDAERSSVCCIGPFVAGQTATCTITALDAEGRITGTEDDACRFNLCPLQDGRGDDVKRHHITPPYFVKTGEFRFHFMPVGSGCQGVAGVGLDGMSLSNKYAFFKVQPNPSVNVTKATSECVVDNQETGDSTCYVIQRDTFGNAVKRCTVDPEGPVNCYHITH